MPAGDPERGGSVYVVMPTYMLPFHSCHYIDSSNQLESHNLYSTCHNPFKALITCGVWSDPTKRALKLSSRQADNHTGKICKLFCIK